VAAQRLVPGVGDAVHTLVGGVRLVGGRVGVPDGAPAALDVAEGVVDVRQLARGAGGDQVLHVVVAVVDAPLGEVAQLDRVHGLPAAPGGAHGGGGAGRAGLVGGVAGDDGVGVRGVPGQAAVGVGELFDGGDLGAVAQDVVVLDA